ncbi:hypothetical protein Tco_1176805 [Tanacetum coccineum]
MFNHHSKNLRGCELKMKDLLRNSYPTKSGLSTRRRKETGISDRGKKGNRRRRFKSEEKNNEKEKTTRLRFSETDANNRKDKEDVGKLAKGWGLGSELCMLIGEVVSERERINQHNNSCLIITQKICHGCRIEDERLLRNSYTTKSVVNQQEEKRDSGLKRGKKGKERKADSKSRGKEKRKKT